MNADDILRAEEDKERKIIELWRSAIDNRVPILQVFAAVSTIVAGALANVSIPWMWAAVAFSALLTGSAVYAGQRETDKISILCEQQRAQQVTIEHEKKAIQVALANMGARLLRELGLWTNTCRVSIYGHSQENLYLLARVSYNPNIRRSGRPEYNDQDGYIGIIWSKGEFIQNWGGKKRAQNFAVNHGYNEELIASLTMLPLSACGIRLEDAGQLPVGVILLESDSKEEINLELTDQIRESPVCHDIQDMVAASERIFEPLSLR